MGTTVNTPVVHRSTLASLRSTLLAEVGNVATVWQVTSLIVILAPDPNDQCEDGSDRGAGSDGGGQVHCLVVNSFKSFILTWNIID